MARVFVATDNTLGRRVVVKVLPPDLAAGINVDRFRREIRVAAGLHHPNILPVHSAGEADGILYYTMPWVEGESLRARLSKTGALPVSDAVHILRDVAKAIAHAHRHGVVHRDIKPENVLLEDDTGLVADFGIAKAIGESTASDGGLTSANIALGTPAYMGPEQAAGDPHVDQRADIYAFGAVGYELLTGEPPFGHRSPQQILAAQIAEEPTPLEQRRPGVPPALAALIMRCLAKHPADRWQSGDVLVQQLDALDTDTASVHAGTTTGAHFWTRAALSLAAVVVIAGIALLWRGRRSPTLEPNLVAVAPFDVLDPKAELWHEGMVDVLSRNLDGVGQLRTVAPTTVIRRWAGRADPASAEELAHQTGAAFVVYGTMLAGTGDSVRVRATLLDVATHRSLGEFEIGNVSERMIELTDSLSAQLIRGLGKVRPIASVRLTSFGTRSLPAIKAFLRGEQFFRHTQWDSALTQYRAAVALDGDFVLALNRSSNMLEWIGGYADSAGNTLALRAGALNHGLAPRESLLVAADSLLASLVLDPATGEVWDRRQRMFATLSAATRRYPEDPEVWYALADARVHVGANLDPPMPDPQILALFDRAIALDSSYTPPYIHSIALGLELGGAPLGRRYLAAYLAHNPPGQVADGLALLPSLLDPARARLPQVEAALSSLSLLGYTNLIDATGAWPDTAETAVRIARAELAAARLHPLGDPMDSSEAVVDLMTELLRRGHFTEAITEGRRRPRMYRSLIAFGAEAALGIAGKDTTAANLGAALIGFGWAMPWWAGVGDTVAIARAKWVSDSLIRAPMAPSRRRAVAVVHAAVAPGYLALARHDTTAALRVFEAYPEDHCAFCEVEALYKAKVLAARGREREALGILDRFELLWPTPWAEIAMLDRGRIAEHLGDKPKAIDSYLVVVEFWRHADPALQPAVREAEDGLRRLSGDAPRPHQ